jgi:hypothetical protein
MPPPFDLIGIDSALTDQFSEIDARQKSEGKDVVRYLNLENFTWIGLG